MTLSMAWRSEENIHLASDSRITFSSSAKVDCGIKVMAIPVKVSGVPLVKDAKYSNVLFSRVYGFCYAGSLPNAATIKELLGELLQQVQFVPPPELLSFEKICEFIIEYCENISSQYCTFLQDGECEFILAGYCPLDRYIKASKFSLRGSGITIKSQVASILTSGDPHYEFIGSGSAWASAFRDPNTYDLQSFLLLLNRIIDEQVDEKVGGDIQYGRFNDNKDFEVLGVARWSLKHLKWTYAYRGFSLYEDWGGMESAAIFAKPQFVHLEVPS